MKLIPISKLARLRLRTLLVAMFVGAFAVMVSCVSVKPGYAADDKLATARAIEEFHARFNARQSDRIYRDAHELFRQSQTKEDLAKNLNDTQNIFGAFKKATSSELNVIPASPIQIRAVYNSTFEKGNATELFVFVKQSDTVQLAQYQIFPGTVRPSAR
jgi:hypothetical protein